MNEKITIKTELLEALNKGISAREETFNNIKKANTEDKRPDVKPNDLIGVEFQAKDIAGEIGSEGDTTIAGCINTIAREMAAFVEGVKGVDAADVSGLLDGSEEEVPAEEDSGTDTGGGGSWWGGSDTPSTDDTPIDENPTEEEPTEDEPTEDEPTEEEPPEEVTVTPVIVDPATLVPEMTQGEGQTTTNDGIGTLTITQSGVEITNGNGETVGTLNEGQYKVYAQMTDETGNVTAVRISPDGEDEQWIRLNQNGQTVGSFYETNQVGSFVATGDQIVVYDGNGNAVETLTPGNYKVYEIKTDANGNVTAIRISKEGEPEKWIQIYENGKYIDGGLFEQYGQQYTNPQTFDNGQGTKATVYGKRNKILGGILGVLVVGLGATIYVKKKKEKEDGTFTEEEEALPEGDYDIYDYNTDDDGNMTSARISDDEAAEEQWVEF